MKKIISANNSLKRNMINFFSQRANRYNEQDISRSGWSSRQTQEERFRVLYEIGIGEHSHVLDVGCGVGDFYQYLLGKGFKGAYSGCDLIKENCDVCREKFDTALFLNSDILDFSDAANFDFVIASGIFFIQSSDWEMSTRAIISKMYAICKKGIAFNFLSSSASTKVDQLKYTDPLEIIPVCQSLTDTFTLRHEYSTKRNDFTIYLFRDPMET